MNLWFNIEIIGIEYSPFGLRVQHPLYVFDDIVVDDVVSSLRICRPSFDEPVGSPFLMEIQFLTEILGSIVVSIWRRSIAFVGGDVWFHIRAIAGSYYCGAGGTMVLEVALWERQLVADLF